MSLFTSNPCICVQANDPFWSHPGLLLRLEQDVEDTTDPDQFLQEKDCFDEDNQDKEVEEEFWGGV